MSRDNSSNNNNLFNRRGFYRLLIWILIAILIVSYFVWMSMVTHHVPGNEKLKSLKKIYLWNSPHRIEMAAFGKGHDSFIHNKCPVSDCVIVANSSVSWKRMTKSHFQILETFDAVLFNIHELWMSPLPPNYYRRPPSQRFVFFTQESPQTMAYFRPESFNKFFNWTMSYRRDSDIQMLYGRVHPLINGTTLAPPLSSNDRSQHPNMQIGNQTGDRIPRPIRHSHSPHKNKTKKVAWMVSHCHTFSKREKYVRKLQEHIQVDVYGGCGPFKCARNDSHWLSEPECYVQLATQYKFYLSFENSICQDYVTEKLFNILQHDMVPVVLGGGDYVSIAPPHSYIDTAWFKTPADLAAYLLYLDGHDDLYEKFFEWKTQYTVEAGVAQMAQHAFCDLCAKLHQPEHKLSKSYTSLLPQWSAAIQCHNPRF